MPAPKIIPTQSVDIQDVPVPGDKWEKLSLFALTFDPLEMGTYGQRAADLNNASSNSSISELRAHLYVEQRRWNHFCREPDNLTMLRLRQVVGFIRQKLESTEGIR